MTPDDIALIGLLLSAAVIGFRVWRQRRREHLERERRKARAAERYRSRYRQAGVL
jgi:type II secretory pathway pseudopilin PulG